MNIDIGVKKELNLGSSTRIIYTIRLNVVHRIILFSGFLFAFANVYSQDDLVSVEISQLDTLFIYYHMPGCVGPSYKDSLKIWRDDNGISIDFRISNISRYPREWKGQLFLEEKDFISIIGLERQCQKFTKRGRCSAGPIYFIFKNQSEEKVYPNPSCQKNSYFDIRNYLISKLE